MTVRRIEGARLDVNEPTVGFGDADSPVEVEEAQAGYLGVLPGAVPPGDVRDLGDEFASGLSRKVEEGRQTLPKASKRVPGSRDARIVSRSLGEGATSGDARAVASTPSPTAWAPRSPTRGIFEKRTEAPNRKAFGCVTPVEERTR